MSPIQGNIRPPMPRGKSSRHRSIRPISPCLLSTYHKDRPGSATSEEPHALHPGEFKVPTTPPRRLDPVQIAREMGAIPPILSPLPVTPESTVVSRPDSPKLSPMYWLELDTSPIPTTPERAPTPSPTRRSRSPTLVLRMGPAPLLDPPEMPPPLAERLQQLFGPTSPPALIKVPPAATPPPPKQNQETLFVTIPLESLRPPGYPSAKRYRFSIPGKAGERPRWVTIPPRGKGKPGLITVPRETIRNQTITPKRL